MACRRSGVRAPLAPLRETPGRPGVSAGRRRRPFTKGTAMTPKFSVARFTTPGLSFAEDLEVFAAAGADGIRLRVQAVRRRRGAGPAPRQRPAAVRFLPVLRDAAADAAQPRLALAGRAAGAVHLRPREVPADLGGGADGRGHSAGRMSRYTTWSGGSIGLSGSNGPSAIRVNPARSSARQEALLPAATGTRTSRAAGYATQLSATNAPIIAAPTPRPRAAGSPMR